MLVQQNQQRQLNMVLNSILVDNGITKTSNTMDEPAPSVESSANAKTKTSVKSNINSILKAKKKNVVNPKKAAQPIKSSSMTAAVLPKSSSVESGVQTLRKETKNGATSTSSKSSTSNKSSASSKSSRRERKATPFLFLCPSITSQLVSHKPHI